jgi:hypothetical protein
VELLSEDLARDSKMKFRIKNGVLVPYVEVDLADASGRLPLESIWIGPIGDQGLAEHVATLLLRSKGYEKAHLLMHTSGYRLR